MTIAQEFIDWSGFVKDTDAKRRARYSLTMKYWTAIELLEEDDSTNEEEVLITCPHCDDWVVVGPQWFIAGANPPKPAITSPCPHCFKTSIKPDPPENLVAVVDKLRASD